MQGEILRAAREAEKDAAVRAVILTSALPTVFSAGLDLKLASSFDGAALRAFMGRRKHELAS